MYITAVRHATIIVHMLENIKILVDPMFADKGTVRAVPDVLCQDMNPLTDLPIPIDELIDCDAILITHLHCDHYDEKAAKLLPKNLPVFCQTEDADRLKKDGFQDVRPVAMDEPIKWGDINIIRVIARHGTEEIADQMAPASGFIIQADCEPTLYIVGDSIWCPCVEKTIKEHLPQIIVCNGGGAHFAHGDPITMNASDIAHLRRFIPESMVIVVHTESWNHCSVTRNGLRSYLSERGLLHKVLIPHDGKVIRPA